LASAAATPPEIAVSNAAVATITMIGQRAGKRAARRRSMCALSF
jgi:hypothetical protein